MMKKDGHYKYNNKLLSLICELAKNGNKRKAFQYINKYLDSYPNDERGKKVKANLLIDMGLYDEAENLMTELNYDETVLNRFRICINKGDYQKAYEYLPKLLKLFDKSSSIYKDYILKYKAFLYYKLGIKATESEMNEMPYSYKQLLSYNRTFALDHIKQHRRFYDDDYGDGFEEEIDINKLFDIIEVAVKNSTPLSTNSHFASEVFLFRYPYTKNVNCNKSFKYIKVVTYTDNRNIITLFPFGSDKRLGPVNELNYEGILVEEKPPVLQISQIDKFKKRYKLQ